MNARLALSRAGIALFVIIPVLATTGLAADSPPSLVGTWTWEWKGSDDKTHHHSLVVEGEGKTLAAQERFDEESPVKVDDFQVEGKKVSFSVTRGERRAAYSGTLGDANTINGNVTVNVAEKPATEFTWTAKHQEEESKP